MGYDEDLRRRLRALESELESGNHPLRPAHPAARRGVRMRPAAAGLGMAVSIAATVALFAQILPGRDSASPRSPGGPSTVAASPTPSQTDSNEGPTPRPVTQPTLGPASFCADPGSRKQPGDGIVIEASPGESQVRAGSGIKLRATFRNGSGAAVQNEEGNPRATFIVTAENGTVVWNSTHGKSYTQEIRSVTYAPGEEAAFEDVWDTRVCGPDGAPGEAAPPGTYSLRAIWTGSQGGWSGLTTFTVV